MRLPGRSLPPPVLLGTVALSLQAGSALATRTFASLGVMGVLGLRMSVGALAVTVGARIWRHRPGRAWPLVVSFATALSVMNALFYASIERIPLGVTVALELTGPLTLALAASRRLGDLAWGALAVVGVAVLVVPGAAAGLRAGGGLEAAGVLCALGAGACWAGYILLGTRLSRAMPTSAGLGWAMLLGSLVLLPWGIASAGRHLLVPSSLAAGAAVGVLSGALPYAVELATMRRVGPRAFGVMMSLEPAAAVAMGAAVAGQHPTPLSLLGIALVAVASLATGWRVPPATASGPVADPALGPALGAVPGPVLGPVSAPAAIPGPRG